MMYRPDCLLANIHYTTRSYSILLFFFFNDTATPEIYTLSLHDALPIFTGSSGTVIQGNLIGTDATGFKPLGSGLDGIKLYSSLDRKSTRLNSSHVKISYAVFCLKKKK